MSSQMSKKKIIIIRLSKKNVISLISDFAETYNLIHLFKLKNLQNTLHRFGTIFCVVYLAAPFDILGRPPLVSLL